MFDVFTDEDEILIKEGIANLYWHKGNLEKCLIRAGVEPALIREIRGRSNANGQPLTKREIMDDLYIEFRNRDKNRRLEVSRNLVRTLLEHKRFVKEDSGHRVDKAEYSALILRNKLNEQQKERERKEAARGHQSRSNADLNFAEKESLRARFEDATKLGEQARGYELERIVVALARAHGLKATDSYKIEGEQIDGTIHFDGHTYLIECKWTESKSSQKDIASLYMKVEGKLDARGLMVSMSGYSVPSINSTPMGRTLRVMLLDANHLTGVIYGQYSFSELLEHVVHAATAKSQIYSDHNIA